MALALPEAGRYFARSLKQSLRLMVGLPDYDAYLTHMAATHPDQPPMSYEAFFRERLEARYGEGKGRCC
ncbi:YbdD/YjiX family protein [Variovorax paradoxus]|nr:YbdD/YjiX family protein [Variovorax paradoxus]